MAGVWSRERTAETLDVTVALDATNERRRKARRLESVSRLAGLLSLSCMIALVLVLVLAGAAEARTRNFCKYEPWYGGKAVSCGRHLQPACSSAPACDAGFNGYSGSPFPVTISCPTIDLPFPLSDVNIPDVKLNSGCYDRRPTCESCGGQGEPPCPPQVAGVCAVGCEAGLEVNTSSLTCEEPAPVGIPCVPGLGNCPSGLVCSLAGQCSHKPAIEGETCDITAPCGPDLTCTAGIPQRCNVRGDVGDACHLTLPCKDGLFCQAFSQVCQAYRKPGQGCSAINPCIDGASCEACFTSKCNAPLQCFWNDNNGLITEQQCRKLYDSGSSQFASSIGATVTYGAGNGLAIGGGESQSVGVAYGQNGEYGCFTTFCYGVDLDVSVEHFVSVGIGTDFDSTDGKSFAVFEEAQTPINLLNFSTSQIFERFGEGVADLQVGALNGTEDALSFGLGPNISPVSAGAMLCETELDPIYTLDGDPVFDGDGPPPAISNELLNPNFDSSLETWSCTNLGVCSWVADDPDASTISGSGQVTSPPSGSLSVEGWLESGCVAVEAGEYYELSAYLRTEGALPGYLLGLWSSSTSCVGGVLRIDLLGTSPPDRTWRRLGGGASLAPPGAQSVKVFVSATRDDATGAASSTQIDQAYVPEPTGALPLAAPLLLIWTLERRRRVRGRRGD